MAEGNVMQNGFLSGETRLKKHETRALQTPGDVLEFWYGDGATNPDTLGARQKMWFQKSDDTDRLIARKGVDLLARLASGEAHKWAAIGPAERLASIIALDQFTRNIFRDSAAAFENDALALQLCKQGLDAGDDQAITPVKRAFFYLPLEHSESLEDQERCVGLFKTLVKDVDDAHRGLAESWLEYARKHREVIEKYERFPHRNAALDRISTRAENDYLAKPGAGF